MYAIVSVSFWYVDIGEPRSYQYQTSANQLCVTGSDDNFFGEIMMKRNFYTSIGENGEVCQSDIGYDLV